MRLAAAMQGKTQTKNVKAALRKRVLGFSQNLTVFSQIYKYNSSQFLIKRSTWLIYHSTWVTFEQFYRDN